MTNGGHSKQRWTSICLIFSGSAIAFGGLTCSVLLGGWDATICAMVGMHMAVRVADLFNETF